MKIIVINLENNKKRLINITKNLNNLGIKFERFNAIYGKNLTTKEIENATTFIGRNFLCNHGVIGCALSHLTIWEQFAKSKDKLVLISEDDVEYNSHFPELLKNIYKIYNETNFDILNLNTSLGIFSSFQNSEYIDKYELNKPIFPLTMASYVISKSGVAKLLNIINNKINYHIDFIIAKENFVYNLNYYALKNINVLNVSYNTESNLISKNNGILNYILDKMGLEKINWFMSINSCCLFLTYSISVYTLILILLIIVSTFSFIKTQRYKTFLILLILFMELLLVNS